MSKRCRKLHQTMARRYAVARGEHPGALYDIDFGCLQQTVEAASEAIYKFAERIAETAKAFMDVVYPWYEANKEEIDEALHHPAADLKP